MNSSVARTPAVPGVLDDPILNRGWRTERADECLCQLPFSLSDGDGRQADRQVVSLAPAVTASMRRGDVHNACSVEFFRDRLRPRWA